MKELDEAFSWACIIIGSTGVAIYVVRMISELRERRRIRRIFRVSQL